MKFCVIKDITNGTYLANVYEEEEYDSGCATCGGEHSSFDTSFAYLVDILREDSFRRLLIFENEKKASAYINKNLHYTEEDFIIVTLDKLEDL